ncbi:MAG TPA: FAD-dependent oxidoreductase, partial [Bdellovibrionales bacterium]|nr:FAD-dependent oxidoreductase [Bdellovibrionales bacterium]
MSENLGRGRPVLVVGAGFSGLVSAYYLNKAGFQVSVIEAKEHAGGLISSIQTSDGLIETAANGLLANRDVELMLADIGVQAMETESHANRRYILREGRARRWPLSFSASLRVAWFVVRFMLARSRVQPRAKETTSAWATRVMGEEASAYLVQTALQGIYAGDPNRMSASLVFGRFFSKTNRAARAKNFRG